LKLQISQSQEKYNTLEDELGAKIKQAEKIIFFNIKKDYIDREKR
jgi:hypothetical protein